MWERARSRGKLRRLRPRRPAWKQREQLPRETRPGRVRSNFQRNFNSSPMAYRARASNWKLQAKKGVEPRSTPRIALPGPALRAGPREAHRQKETAQAAPLPESNNPSREASTVSANSIFWLRDGVQHKRPGGGAGNHGVTVLTADSITESMGLKWRIRQDLVLGQNSWIFALKLDLPNASLAQNH